MKAIHYSLTLLTFSALICFMSCQQDPELPSALTNNAGFPDHIERILTLNCATQSCHSGSMPASALDLTDWKQMFEGGKHGAAVIPHDAEYSPLYEVLLTESTTYEDYDPTFKSNHQQLPIAEILTLREWIESGAKDKQGNFIYEEEQKRRIEKLFVANAGSDRISVINTNTHLVMHNIEVGTSEDFIESPFDLQLSPDNEYLFVTMVGSGTIEKYRTDNYAFEGSTEIGRDIAKMAISGDGNKMAITHWNDFPSPKISLVHTQSMQLYDQIVGDGETLSFGMGIAATNDFRTLYAIAEWGNYYVEYKLNSNFMVVSSENFVLEPNDPIPHQTQQYGGYDILLSPDEQFIYISCNQEDLVRKYDRNTHQLITKIPVGEFPRKMLIGPATQRLYVSCRFGKDPVNPNGDEGSISVVDLANDTEIKRIYLVGDSPSGIQLNATDQILYVVSEQRPTHLPPGPSIIHDAKGKVTLVDTDRLEVIPHSEIPVGIFPGTAALIK